MWECSELCSRASHLPALGCRFEDEDAEEDAPKWAGSVPEVQQVSEPWSPQAPGSCVRSRARLLGAACPLRSCCRRGAWLGWGRA